jgi:hypothetical protein
MRGAQARGVADLGCACCAGGMAGGALDLEHLFAGFQFAVGIADLDRADLLDALLRSPSRVAGTGSGFVSGHHKIHQPDDDEHRGHKRKEHRHQQLFGRLDGARVVFLVAVVAHGVLNSRLACRNQPAIIAVAPFQTFYNAPSHSLRL